MNTPFRPATFALALALLAPAAPASLARQDEAPAAPQNPASAFEPIAADGYRAFLELMEEFARTQFERLPSADKTARENAYGKLAAIQLAGTTSVFLLPVAGAALGGGIGLCVDVCAAGSTVGSGTAVGSAIGLGSGVAVGAGAFIASLLATLPMIDEIERNYPAEAAPAAPQGRILRGAHFSSAAPAFVAPSRAGAFESYYVNLVCSLPDAFVTLVQRWDATPGLGNRERAWLRSISFARPHLERLAWIKQNRRVAPGAPLADDLFMDVGRVLSGDQAAIERTWLNALGLGSTGLSVDDGKLALSVPPPLRAFGLPARLTANVPDVRVKVGGNGGLTDPFLRFRMEAGPFDLDWGTVQLVPSGRDRGLIALTYSLADNARLGAARISFKAGGDETTVLDLRPTLGQALQGKLFFRLNGLALEFVRADIMGLSLRFGIPQEIRNLPIVKDLLSGLLKDVERNMEAFFKEHIPFAGLFSGFEQGAVQALAANVQQNAGHFGLNQVQRLTKAEVVNGKLQLHVQGRELRAPELKLSSTDATALLRGLNNRPRLTAPLNPGRITPRELPRRK